MAKWARKWLRKRHIVAQVVAQGYKVSGTRGLQLRKVVKEVVLIRHSRKSVALVVALSRKGGCANRQ